VAGTQSRPWPPTLPASEVRDNRTCTVNAGRNGLDWRGRSRSRRPRDARDLLSALPQERRRAKRACRVSESGATWRPAPFVRLVGMSGPRVGVSCEMPWSAASVPST
jgi:hypothetical protein